MNRNHDISQSAFDSIERYLLKEMDEKEHEAFTLRLLNENTLQEQMEEVRMLLLGVQETSLAQKMNEFHKALPDKKAMPASGKVFSIKRWSVAAAVVLFLGAGIWLFLNRQSNEEKLYSAYYKADPGLVTAMSTSDNYLFDRAMIDYKTGSYDSAIKAWEGLLAAKPGNDTLNYFIGSSYLALEKNEKAITYLERVEAVTDSYFLKDSYWYHGLALLKIGRKKEAVSFIEQSDHQQKAALLEKLRANP